MPVYQVTLQKTEPAIRLIEAKNQSAAIAFAIRDWVSACKPASKELVHFGSVGIEIETAEGTP